MSRLEEIKAGPPKVPERVWGSTSPWGYHLTLSPPSDREGVEYVLLGKTINDILSLVALVAGYYPQSHEALDNLAQRLREKL